MIEKIKNFATNCIDYLKANPALAFVLAAAAVFIVIVLVVIITLSVKRSKARKRLAATQANEAKTEKKTEAKTQESYAAAPIPSVATPEKSAAELEKEKQEAARKAVFERLEAQRLEAEREEAEQQAAAKAKAEEEAKANATTAKKPAAKKSATKNAAPKKSVEKQSAPVKEEKPTKLYEEMKDAEEEDDIWYDENETEKAARYSGKWVICRVVTDDKDLEETYFFELHASNGEKLLSSEEYTSYNGALRGIETHKTNIEKGNFKVTLSKKGDYIFKLLSGKNMLLCMGENYPTQARCESAIESTKRFAKTAVLDENLQDHIVKVPSEDDTEIEPIADGYNGKWIIFSREGVNGEKLFYFELFANNGEKLLSSEDYTSYIGAVNGIQTHKTNIEKGNFRISLTKRGDYIYKLLNGNGQLLCLGEHYKTKRRCQNAVESVKRFAANSPVLADSTLTK